MMTLQSALPTDEYATVAHISGVDRFDIELEAWLTSRQWIIRRNLLSRAIEVHRPAGIVPLTDERLAEIRFTFKYESNGKEPAKDKIADALILIAERRAYHPVKDYLDNLQWDGASRLNSWLVDYAGAADTALNRAFSRKILCAAVRRVKQPGCKFDHVLVLQGEQGFKKSSLLRALCHDEAWYTDQVKVGANAKETIEITSGKWIVELAELDGMGRREANAVKSFITTVSDKARAAYARYAVDVPRQFVLFGTTNENKFLNDTTGNRRWWPVPAILCDVAGLSEIRDQLWAEAVQAEPNEALWIENDILRADAAALTTCAVDFGPWFDILADKFPAGPIKVAVVDAWKLAGVGAGEVNKISVQSRTNLRRAMAGLGFDPETKNVRCDGKQVRCFVRGAAMSAKWWSPDGGGGQTGYDLEW